MEPLRINVEIGLQESTIQRLGQIMTACIGGARPAQPAVPAPVEARTAPKPEPPAPAPEAPAAAPIDNMTLMSATKTAKEKSGPDAVREVFKRFGIAASRDCPQERRADLLSELKALS